MRNEKAEKRKKKLAERQKRSNELAKRRGERELLKNSRLTISDPKSEFPGFVIDDPNGDSEFVRLDTEAIGKFRFEDVNPLLQITGTGLPHGLTVAGPVKLDGSIKMEFAQPAKTELQASVELNGGTLAGSLPGETAPMAEFKKAVAQVSVWPLPRNQVELKAVVIDGLTLRLVRDHSGKFNLQTWLASLGGAAKTDPSPPVTPPVPPAVVTIDTLHLSNAHLLWRVRR